MGILLFLHWLSHTVWEGFHCAKLPKWGQLWWQKSMRYRQNSGIYQPAGTHTGGHARKRWPHWVLPGSLSRNLDLDFPPSLHVILLDIAACHPISDSLNFPLACQHLPSLSIPGQPGVTKWQSSVGHILGDAGLHPHEPSWSWLLPDNSGTKISQAQAVSGVAFQRCSYLTGWFAAPLSSLCEGRHLFQGGATLGLLCCIPKTWDGEFTCHDWDRETRTGVLSLQQKFRSLLHTAAPRRWRGNLTDGELLPKDTTHWPA